MEHSEKLSSSKAVIAYIAELFPNCFALEGEAKPLKIGIFQDLAQRLEGDEKVSKTQLRAALRQYTSSWRYLHCVKLGAVRVDLDGHPCGELEQSHIEHAQKALSESKAKARERRKEQELNKKKIVDKKPRGKLDSAAAEGERRQVSAAKVKKVKRPVQEVSSPLDTDELTEGRDVKVNMGNGNIAASIVEINKDGVRVRLANGLVMLVKTEHLCL